MGEDGVLVNGYIHPSRIGFDIDGVVADTGGAFLRILREEYGINSYRLEDKIGRASCRERV